MPVSARWWDAEQTIILYRFIDSWTWDQFYNAYREAVAMARSVPHRVDIIHDALLMGGIPHDVLMHMKSLLDEQPANVGLSIIVTVNPFVNSFYHVGVRFYGKIAHYVRVAPNVEAAEKIIAESRREESTRHIL